MFARTLVGMVADFVGFTVVTTILVGIVLMFVADNAQWKLRRHLYGRVADLRQRASQLNPADLPLIAALESDVAVLGQEIDAYTARPYATGLKYAGWT